MGQDSVPHHHQLTKWVSLRLFTGPWVRVSFLLPSVRFQHQFWWDSPSCLNLWAVGSKRTLTWNQVSYPMPGLSWTTPFWIYVAEAWSGWRLKQTRGSHPSCVSGLHTFLDRAPQSSQWEVWEDSYLWSEILGHYFLPLLSKFFIWSNFILCLKQKENRITNSFATEVGIIMVPLTTWSGTTWPIPSFYRIGNCSTQREEDLDRELKVQ